MPCIQQLCNTFYCRTVASLQEYGAQIKKFGLQPSAVKHYQDLWQIVAPVDKQIDAHNSIPP